MERKLIEINHYRTVENTKLRNHYHNGYELIFIEDGASNFVIEGQSRDFGPNHLIFINNLEQHEMSPVKTPYSRFVFIIDPDLLDSALMEPALSSIFKNRPESFKNGFKLTDDDSLYVKKQIHLCYADYQKQDAFWRLNVISILTNLFIFLYRNYSSYFPFSTTNHKTNSVIQVQSYIDENYLENLSLDMISSIFHLDKFYIAHIFKEVTGYTIKQYILLKRLAYAKNLLYYTNDNITQVAMNSGFNSASNFIRIFKKREGMPPLQFRKKSQSL